MTATNTPATNTIHSARDLQALQKQLREDTAIGLIYETHAHNCTLRTGEMQAPLYGREAVISHWLGELHGFSEQQLSDSNAFAAPDTIAPKQSQLMMSRARVQATHSGENVFGCSTGTAVQFRTQSFCRVANGRLLEEWQFTDRLHLALQMGLSPQHLGRHLAQKQYKMQPRWHTGELASGQGQTGPEPSEANAEQTQPVLCNWVDALNSRRFDRLTNLYQCTARIHAPGGRTLDGPKALARFWLSLIAALPDCRLEIQHLVTDNETQQLGLLWRLCGHHSGPGLTPEPAGQRLSLHGISQWQLEDGKISDEWTLFDEIELIAQSFSQDTQAGNKL